MGQSSSALQAHECGDPLCGVAAGCLSAPRFLRRRGAAALVFEEYDVSHEAAFSARGAETSPADLVLTDVEDDDGGDDYSDGDGDGDDEKCAAGNAGANSVGGWLPDYVASHCAPPPEPASAFMPAAATHGRQEQEGKGREATAIPKKTLDRLVAVDCGMVMVRRAPTQELRRLSVVDGRGAPLLSAVVRVDEDLLRGKRRVNGRGDALDEGVRSTQIKEEVARLLRGKVVVGHQVEGDLAMLGLGRRAPAKDGGRAFEVRDTARYPLFRGQHGARKLRDLVKEKLDRDIQPSGQHHCCEEDAVAALDLYKSVWHQWEAMSTITQAIRTSTAVAKQSKETHQAQKPSNQKRGRARRGGKKKKGRNDQRHEREAKPQNRTSSPGQRSKTNQRGGEGGKKQKPKGQQKKQRKQTLSMKIKKQNSRRNKEKMEKMRHHYSYLSSARRLLVSSTKALFIVPTRLSAVLRNSLAPATATTAPNLRRRKGKRKKQPHYPRLWPTKHLLDSALLLCHCLLEAWGVALLGIARAAPWTVQSAHGALTAGLVGLELLRRGRRRNDKGAGVLYGLLAQHHGVSALARVAGGVEFAAAPTATPTAGERGIASVMAALARQIIDATPMALVQQNSGQVAAREASGLCFGQILPFTHMSWAPSRDFTQLCCDMLLSCWFVLRSCKKL